jgi:hypothetical protein
MPIRDHDNPASETALFIPSSRGAARRLRAAGTLVLFAALAAGCAQPASKPPPAPNVNLSGYPPEFRQGYADGCSSAGGSRTRNEERFKSDPQYAAGWRDGNDICRKR